MRLLRDWAVCLMLGMLVLLEVTHDLHLLMSLYIIDTQYSVPV